MTSNVHYLRTIPIASVQGSLALELERRIEPSLDEVIESTIPAMAPSDVVHVATATRQELERWARRYAQAAAEVATGDRPAAQVLRWTTPRVYADLVRRGTLVARAGAHAPGFRPARAATGPRATRRQITRPQVRGVRISFVAGHIVEASIHVRYGARSRAIAARFEVIEDRWQCSALEFA